MLPKLYRICLFYSKAMLRQSVRFIYFQKLIRPRTIHPRKKMKLEIKNPNLIEPNFKTFFVGELAVGE